MRSRCSARVEQFNGPEAVVGWVDLSGRELRRHLTCTRRYPAPIDEMDEDELSEAARERAVLLGRPGLFSPALDQENEPPKGRHTRQEGADVI